MTTTTIELYNALKQAGVDEEKAREVSENIVLKSDAVQFATKSDLKDLRVELYKALAVQTVVTVGAVVSLLQII